MDKKRRRGEAIELIGDWDPSIQRSLSADWSRTSCIAGVVVCIRLSPLLECVCFEQSSRRFQKLREGGRQRLGGTGGLEWAKVAREFPRNVSAENCASPALKARTQRRCF